MCCFRVNVVILCTHGRTAVHAHTFMYTWLRHSIFNSSDRHNVCVNFECMNTYRPRKHYTLYLYIYIYGYIVHNIIYSHSDIFYHRRLTYIYIYIMYRKCVYYYYYYFMYTQYTCTPFFTYTQLSVITL